MYPGEVGESENPNGAVRARSDRGTDAGSGRRLLARETEPGSAPDLRQNHSAKALSRENPVDGRPFDARQAGARFRLPSTGDPYSPHTGREAMTAANISEPAEPAISRAKGPARGPRRRRRISARTIGLWLVVGGLSALFAIITVAVALVQIRNFQPAQLGLAALFLAPIGGAIAAIVLDARGLGRATLGRTQAVEAARASESGFRTVAATMADGILTIDERSRIQYMNDAAAKLFGYSQDELLGHELTEVMPERFRPRHLSAFRKYLETGEKHVPWQGIEFAGLHKAGHEIPIEVSLGEYSAGGRRLFIGVV